MKFIKNSPFCCKFWKSTFGILLFGIAVLSCFALQRWLLKQTHLFPLCLYQQPLKQVHFSTNGVLKSSILMAYGIPTNGINLMDIDIEILKKRLESIEQVQHAEIERRFSEQSLYITLCEEQPFARIVVDMKQQKKVLWVAHSGKIFSTIGPDSWHLNAFPFLTGLSVQKQPDGDYRCKHNLMPIKIFLDRIQKEHPTIYTQILHISLTHWNPSEMARWSRIEITTQQVKRIIFAPIHFEEQLQHLEYILKEDHLKGHFPLNCIDLRSGVDVSVRLKNYQD